MMVAFSTIGFDKIATTKDFFYPATYVFEYT